MALPVISNVFRCAWEQLLGDQPMVNVFHIQAQSVVSTTTLADGVVKSIGHADTFPSLQSIDVGYSNLHVTKLDGLSLSVDFGFGGAAHSAGTVNDNAVPSPVCLVLSHGTGARGRSHRGRTYLGGVAQTNLEAPAAHWASSLLTEAETVWSNFQSVLSSQTGTLSCVLASYKLAEAFPITTTVARRDFGSQRNRSHI